MKYVPGSTLFHLWEVVQIFQRESIVCRKISSGGSLFIKKLVPGGTNLEEGGVHFYHDNSLVVEVAKGPANNREEKET